MHAPPPPPPPPQFRRIPVQTVWNDNLDAVRSGMAYFVAHARCVAVKVGLAICTDEGLTAAWEFNLSDFDPAVDLHVEQSLSHLGRRGLNCLSTACAAFPWRSFARALRFSGLFSNRPEVSWITHTGAYHIAYRDMAGFLGAVRRSLGDNFPSTMSRGWPPTRKTCLPMALEGIAYRFKLAPPLSTNQLAGFNSVLVAEAFRVLRSQPFRRHVTRFRGLLQGLQTV
ncbi:hypothetical protein BS78_03G381400 [Paspalum vaginatum]|nr:hypothetical protein BS78_03G381400 [Paspalum vaginatum]